MQAGKGRHKARHRQGKARHRRRKNREVYTCSVKEKEGHRQKMLGRETRQGQAARDKRKAWKRHYTEEEEMHAHRHTEACHHAVGRQA